MIDMYQFCSRFHKTCMRMDNNFSTEITMLNSMGHSENRDMSTHATLYKNRTSVICLQQVIDNKSP